MFIKKKKKKSAFDACQSDTPRGAPIPIFSPGARNPRYATESPVFSMPKSGNPINKGHSARQAPVSLVLHIF